MVKLFAAAFAMILYAACAMFKAIIYGIAYIIAQITAASENRRLQKQVEQQALETQKQAESDLMEAEHQIISLENQIQAELGLADACMKKAATEGDSYKRAQWRKKAQQAEAKADALQLKIDKLKKKI